MRPFKKPASFDYNLVVIGAGSAGLVAANIAASARARVALIEKADMGGDCLNTGCVPSKALIRSAKMLAQARHADRYGFRSINIEYDFKDVMQRIRRVITTIAPHDSVERYTELGVDCIKGAAEILSPYEVRVNGKSVTTRNIIIATGASPCIPPVKGLEQVPYYTSDTIWELDKLPQRLTVLGGGAVGTELSQSFARLGSKVTQVEMQQQLLPLEDPDIADLIKSRLEQEGIRVLTGHRVDSAEPSASGVNIACSINGSTVQVQGDTLLIAVGRKANTAGFGLENLGVRLSKNGSVETDQHMRTNYRNIYACGDVAGPYQFTHMASHQAWYAALNALLEGIWKVRTDYSAVPWATFTDPEVARVGLNEQEARRLRVPYEVTRYNVDELDRAITDESAYGIVKVLTRPGQDNILGATIVSEYAGELITEFVSAMRSGYGMNRILGTIHIYPTFSEANKHAAGKWKKNHVPHWLLSLAGKLHDWRRG